MTKSSPDTPVIPLEEVDSTSNFLNKISTETKLVEFAVVRASYQTAGKGQRGNGWESEYGKNLLFSMIMYPEFLEARKQFALSEVIALAIKEELDTMADEFSIKWPNDIYWRDMKICGTLIENDLLGNTITKSIAGIGVNINQESFSRYVPNAVSLRQITGKDYDIESILHGIIHRIIENYALLKSGGFEEISHRYHTSLFRKEGMHGYQDEAGQFFAKIVCVKPGGTLVLMDDEGMEREYAFKEVKYLHSASDKELEQ